MHTIELHNNRTIELPEYLGEFTGTQFIQFCKLMVKFLSGQVDYGTFRIHLLYKMLNMKHSHKAFKADQIDIRNENIYTLSTLLDDYFTDKKDGENTVKKVNLTFVDNKIPSFRFRGIKYMGPDDALTNISFDEYIEANTNFKEFAATGNNDSLDKLVATLYRPAKWPTPKNIRNNYDGDRRVGFVQAAVARRAKRFKKLPYHIKYGIFLFFWACSEFIATAKDVEVEGQQIDLSVLFNQTENTGKKGIGMVGLLFSLAETKVFGNKAETGKERFWNILLRLYQNHLQAEELKQKAKK